MILLIKSESTGFLLSLLLLQFTLDIAVLFNIPIVRQIVGFLYLTFIPGFIAVKLFKFDSLDKLEILLFSVGFSVIFLMLFFLLVNEFGLLFGISHPLSLMYLMITLNILTLAGGILVYLKEGYVEVWKGKLIRLLSSTLFFLCLPFLSVIGAIYMSVYENNFLLLLMIILISIVFISGVLSRKLLSPKLYPLAVSAVAIALLYHSSFISNYIIPFGSDVPGEYLIFRTVKDNACWSSTLYTGMWYGRLNAMLSITILPASYAIILNMSPTWVFKMLYPVIFSLVPLGLYQFWQKYIGKKYAFISAFLFMANETFYTEMLGLNRQMIAEFFFVLLLLVMMNQKIKPFKKIMSFAIFGFALIVSHYALAEIFLFFISFALVSLIIIKRPSKNITISMVVLFSVLMFTWYIYTCGSATFNSTLEFGDYVYRELGDFFNPASRGEVVLRGLGLEKPPSIWNTISRMFAYFTEVFIFFGFIGLITKRTDIPIKKEQFTFTLLAIAFLFALIIVPGLANTLKMTRFYHVLLFFLAPLCALGAEFTVKLLFRHKRKLVVSILLLIVLVSYFLFQTEFMFEVVKSDSWSIPLSKYRMDPIRLYGHYGYMDAYSVYGAQWLSGKVAATDLALYADKASRLNVLSSYGGMYLNVVTELTNVTIPRSNEIIYLYTLNLKRGILVSRGRILNVSSLTFNIEDINKIYTNGNSEVYIYVP